MACGLRTLDDEVHPVAGNIDARHPLDDLVDLRDDDAAAERRRLDDDRRVLGVGARIEVAVPVRRLRADQTDARRQVDRSTGRTARGRCGSRRPTCAPTESRAASRAACGPEKEKSSLAAMPRSNTSRCSGRASTDCTMCRSWTLRRIDAASGHGRESPPASDCCLRDRRGRPAPARAPAASSRKPRRRSCPG